MQFSASTKRSSTAILNFYRTILYFRLEPSSIAILRFPQESSQYSAAYEEFAQPRLATPLPKTDGSKNISFLSYSHVDLTLSLKQGYAGPDLFRRKPRGAFTSRLRGSVLLGGLRRPPVFRNPRPTESKDGPSVAWIFPPKNQLRRRKSLFAFADGSGPRAFPLFLPGSFPQAGLGASTRRSRLAGPFRGGSPPPPPLLPAEAPSSPRRLFKMAAAGGWGWGL